MPISRILSQPRKARRWRVEGLVQDGTLSVVAGAAGDGKTWLGMALAYGVEDGASPAGFACEKGRAIVFDAEMGADLYAERLRDAGLVERFPVYDAMGLDLSRADDLAWMRVRIGEHAANFVVLDSLRRLTPTSAENESDAMAPIVANVAKLARDTRAAILLLHHKGDGQHKLYRGSSAIKDQADALFGLVRAEDDDELRRITCAGGAGKMRYAPEPPDRWFRLCPGGGVVVAESDAPTTTTPRGGGDTRLRAKEVLDANPNLSQRELASEVGVARGNQTIREVHRAHRDATNAGAGTTTTEILLDVLEADVGARTEDLELVTGKPADALRPALEDLAESGQVRTNGDRWWRQEFRTPGTSHDEELAA